MATATREAACHCGQLRLEVSGEPFRVSICNCLDCQRHHILDHHLEPEGLPELSAVEQDLYALYHRHEDAGAPIL